MPQNIILKKNQEQYSIKKNVTQDNLLYKKQIYTKNSIKYNNKRYELQIFIFNESILLKLFTFKLLNY